MSKTNIFKNKRFKYGSLSVVFTVLFIAMIIVLNLIVTSIDEKVGLRIDLTQTQLYSISEDTDTALRVGLGDEYDSFDVTIYFLADRDLFTYYDTAYYNANGTDRVIPDIDIKRFEETALTLTTEQAEKLTWFVTLTFPLVIICIGFAVFVRRRHL